MNQRDTTRQAPLVMLGRDSPRLRRRRRQSRRQSSCCCCLLAAIILIVGLVIFGAKLRRWLAAHRAVQSAPVANLFPLDVTLDQPSYYRYGLVEIALKLTDAKGRPLKPARPPRVVVRDGSHQLVTTVGNVEELAPRYDAKRGLYLCWWPVPWNAQPGRYLVEARAAIPDFATWPWVIPDEHAPPSPVAPKPPKVTGRSECVVAEPFQIVGRAPTPIPSGMCAVTWEENAPTGQMEGPTGTKGDWRTMFDWAEYMGADTLWFRGAVTSAYAPPRMSMDQPWNSQDYEFIATIGAEAHRRGLKFGAWAMAMETIPYEFNRYKPPYRFAQDFSSSGGPRDTHFISFDDRNRIAQLTAFFKFLQQMPQVDYLGLDYMRVEHAYEMTDDFTAHMPVKLPTNWSQLPQSDRWRYMANKIEREWNDTKGQDFYECWNWWRAHTGAQIVNRMMTDAKVDKPVWVFMLSWMRGRQHGQDPVMFQDAGVSLVAPMLYQCRDYDQFDRIINDWAGYLRPAEVDLIPGDQVDDYWHKKSGVGHNAQRSRRPAAPEVLYERMLRGHNQMVPTSPSVGLFWHDISRAVSMGSHPAPNSNLGPYPGREWALAGGAAFSRVRESWKVYPIKAELTLPAQAALSGSFQATLKIQSFVDRPVRDISIELQPTPQIIIPADQRIKSIAELGPGETHTIPLRLGLTSGSAARQNRFMVAARVTWPSGKYGRTVREDLPRVIIVMRYLNGV